MDERISLDAVKAYLDQVRDLTDEIKVQERVLDALRSDIDLQSTGTDQVGSRSIGHVSDSVATAAMRLYDMDQTLTEKRALLNVVKGRLMGQMDAMPTPIYRQLLLCRYILLMTWTKVGGMLGYDVRQVYRLHERALIEFVEIFQKDVTSSQSESLYTTY